ncbi:hypothetical protein NT6N_14240 [Oceaniferula spumae]|uniref:NAD-dependent epimerase/dehydratase domain-containing protein n=1 Tax=Oceaniferula spumae TaxID=2979115 RepID=A0AAT9FK75_9BACT
MAKLLIAGYGFLGEALAREFSAAGWEITTLSRSDEANLRCDISAADQVSALPGSYDLVIQCAATGGGGEEGYRRVYLDGSKNLLGRFSDAEFIFVSSTSVYAQADHSEVDESSPAEPTTVTGKILKQAEDQVLASGGAVARLSGLYGPARCHILKNLLAGKAKLDGQGDRVMNYVHRDDAARALSIISKEMSGESRLYNVSAGSVTQRDCYRQLADHFSLPMPPSVESDGTVRKRGNSSKYVSSARIEALGWKPAYPDFLSLALACEIA